MEVGYLRKIGQKLRKAFVISETTSSTVFFACVRQKNEIKKTQNKVNQSFQPKCSLKFTQTLNNKCTRKKDLLKLKQLGLARDSHSG